MKKAYRILLIVNLSIVLLVFVGAIIPFCNYTLDNKLNKRIYSKLDKLSMIQSLDNKMTALEQEDLSYTDIDGRIIAKFQGTLSNDVKFPVFATFDRVFRDFYYLKDLTILVEGRNIQVNHPSISQLKRLLVNTGALLLAINTIVIFSLRRKGRNAAKYHHAPLSP
jgi:hypothetical protein